MTKEMGLLRELLDSEGIVWSDASEPHGTLPIYRTHFEHRGYRWSVIHGYGSYGGWSRLENDRGLLELMSGAVNGGEPIGFLTAKEAMEYIKGGRK